MREPKDAKAIWEALGDTSDDLNWYTKRSTLSGVYSSTVLYWLGDDSTGSRGTWEFLDRRIDDVMQIEKFKAELFPAFASLQPRINRRG